MNPIIKKLWTRHPAELTDTLKRIDSTEVHKHDEFVFKISQQFLSEILDSPSIIAESYIRSHQKDIYLIYFDAPVIDFKVFRLRESIIEEIEGNSVIPEIRTRDLQEVVSKTYGDCIIEAPHGSHFKTPSGSHSKKFLRIADALYSYGALDRISYWLQPYLINADAVMIDSWSISSAVLKAQQLIGKSIPFECFRSHISTGEDSAIEVLDKLSSRAGAIKEVVFFISFHSTGKFIRLIPSLVDKSSLRGNLLTVPIYALKNSSVEVRPLCELDLDVESFDEDSCPLCKSETNEKVIHIDPKYYFPRALSENPIRFTWSLLNNDKIGNPSDSSDFIQEYGEGQGILQVHRTDQNDENRIRHHSFYINVTALLELEKFRAELQLKLNMISSEHGIPDILFAPRHDAARKIIGIAKEIFPSTDVIRCNDLKTLTSRERMLVKGSKRIIFLDDATISGSRINLFLRGLRESFSKQDLVNLETFVWFPLIARPESDRDFEVLSDAISNHRDWRNVLVFLHYIVLPNWTSRNSCPWCRESQYFGRNIPRRWNLPNWYQKRLDTLGTGDEGVQKSPFLNEPLSEEKRLGEGSPLARGGISEIQVLFLIAHGLQLLRSRSDQPLGRNIYFERNVLFWDTIFNPKDNSFLRYTEPLIQKAFLRAAKPLEWSEEVKAEAINFLLQRVSDGTCSEIAMEILLFLVRVERMSPLPEPVRKDIQSICDDEVIQSILGTFQNLDT